jgi:hypothetical protein
MKGTLTYWVSEGKNRLRLLKLTVCADDGGLDCGIGELRRKKLSRILDEALAQGVRLSYSDLSMIMLTSKATLKRDVSRLREQGVDIRMGERGL